MPIGKISFDLSNGTRYSRALLARVEAFLSSPAIGYKIVVPDDLKWWYWLEFGTAGRQDADAPYRTEHGGTYAIDPINGKALKFVDSSGKNRFAFHVDHPGIRPRLIYRGVRSDILAYAKESIMASFQNGISPEMLRVALSLDILPYALEKMAARLEEQAPGVKERGNNPFGG